MIEKGPSYFLLRKKDLFRINGSFRIKDSFVNGTRTIGIRTNQPRKKNKKCEKSEKTLKKQSDSQMHSICESLCFCERNKIN